MIPEAGMSAWRTWLQPGMRVKRWGTLALLGLTGMVLSVAVGLVWAYRSYYFELQADYPILRPLTLQFIPHPWREVVLLLVGLTITIFAAIRLNQALFTPLLAREASGRALAQIVAEHRFGPTRPSFGVVAIGGGTGLSSLLRGLKIHDAGITAIVTVADDGGSTGRLRAEFDIPAPGDIRNCIAALADDEALVTKLFQHRFQGDGSTLSGHSFGNLFITALTRTTGSFERAVEEASQVLNIRGRVLPATLENVRLSAEMTDGTILHGESSVGEHGPRGKRIKGMFLTPRYPEAHAPALGAILNADLIVLGPGSLFTSVVPNLLVAGIPEAIRWSEATVVYCCNVATQPGETDDFDAADHVRVITELLGPGRLDAVLVNANPASIEAAAGEDLIRPVLPGSLASENLGVQVIARDVASETNPLRHDPQKLAAVLMELASSRPARRPQSMAMEADAAWRAAADRAGTNRSGAGPDLAAATPIRRFHPSDDVASRT
jgi:uncharacterized cofD-like protein